MIRDTIPALAAAALFALASATGAHAASLDLADGCARAHAATVQEGGGPRGAGFDATRLEVTVPGLNTAEPPFLHAGHLHVAARGPAEFTRPAQLEQAATAAAATLLTALAGHHGAACPDPVLQDAADPVARGLRAGASYDFTWSDLSIRSGSARFGARHLSLHLAGGSPRAQLSVALDNAVSNDPASGLLPQSLDVRASLPADQLPQLLSATGGDGAPVNVSIEHAEARRGETTLSGQGDAALARSADASSGQGHVVAHDLDGLIQAATESGLNRIRTALFLAKLVAHRQGDDAAWDLSWAQGTLLVNNVPLPLR